MRAFSRREALAGLFNLTGAALISGCAINPVTGRKEFMLMTEHQEIALGKNSHGDIVKMFGMYGNQSIQTWFNNRGQEMAQVTHRKNLPYTFTVLDSPVVNAFAVPGGYVYVTRGILGYFNNEAQFAGVLGHELGHVNARHSASKYTKAQFANLALGIGSIFSEEFAKYSQLGSIGVALMFLKFSRNDEREADKLGVEYSSKAGYDAREMSSFFHMLERLNPSGGSLPSWMSTHPDPGDRVRVTLKLASNFQTANPDLQYTVKRDNYLDVIDGIVYGDDPKQGYVKDNLFIHPEMKFIFPVPKGWNLTNNPSEVRMEPQDKNALLIFTVAKGVSPQDALTQFTKENSITIEDSRNATVNGMNALRITGKMVSGGSQIPIISHFIMKDDIIVAFHGLSSETTMSSFVRSFDDSASGFKKISDKSLLNVASKKIQIRSVKNNKTLREVLNSFGVPEKNLDEHAILNGMDMMQVVSAGTKLKIVS